MKNLHFLSGCSPEEIRQMLAEAERALQLAEANPKTELTCVTCFRLEGEEILTLESVIPAEFLVGELVQIVQILKEELP